jgi:hypothetical protein
MAKKIKMTAVCAVDCSPPMMSKEEQKEKYKKGYEFNKRDSVRLPVDGWDKKYLIDAPNPYAPQKEVDLVKGKPHGFRGRRTGNSYGNRPATRTKRAK